MEHSRQAAGPETAWYEERLRGKRIFQLVAGCVIFMLGPGLLIVAFLLTPDPGTYTIPVLILLALLPVLQGGGLIIANWRSVTPEAVTRLRSQERTQLFRQAQGALLPWQYRRWARVLEGLFGLLMLASTIQTALGAARLSNKNTIEWVALTFCTLIGLLLVIDGIYLKSRRARRFAKRSIRELAYRLSMGELLTDNPPKPEQ